LVLGSDPLDISNELPKDYRNWASVMSQVLLKKEGSEEGAIDALGRVMLAAHGHLAKGANGEELFPRFHLTDPVFHSDMHGLGEDLEAVVGKVAGKVKGKMPVTEVTKFEASKTFFNFAPCVLSESKVRLLFYFVFGKVTAAGGPQPHPHPPPRPAHTHRPTWRALHSCPPPPPDSKTQNTRRRALPPDLKA